MKTTRGVTVRLSLILLIVLGAASAGAQGIIASGTISGGGSGPSYDYSLTFSDGVGATSPIGSVWYAWTPGNFYLPGTPTTALAPTGWTALVNGKSVEFYANSSTYYIAAGQTLSGFSYQATFSPAQLAAAPNSGESVAYSAGILSGSSDTFTVQTVPEPSMLGLLAVGFLSLVPVWQRKLGRRGT